MEGVLDRSAVNYFRAASVSEIGTCVGLGRKGSGDVSSCDRTEIAALDPNNVEGPIE